MAAGEYLGIETMLLCILLIVFVFCSVYLEKWNIHFIHQTGISISLGLLFGYILWQTSGKTLEFEGEVFFYYILPMIIFAAGYNMKRKRFMRNIGYISIFGIIGTLLSFILIGIGAWLLSYYDQIVDLDGNVIHISLNEALAFGSVLASSDAVAVLTIVKEAEAPQLFNILFGEGIVNDAIAIILFKSVQQIDFGDIQPTTIPLFIGLFVENLILSLLIGIFFGLVSSLITKHCTGLQVEAVFETAMVLFIAYFAYIVAELAGFSGVITVLMCAITMAHYTWYNLSKQAQYGTSQSFDLLGHVAESFVFVYLGFSAFNYYSSHWSFGFIGYMIIIVMLARLLHIYFLSGLMKLFMGKKFELTCKGLNIIWLGGAIRGAVAFALILSVEGDHKKLIITSTLGLVIFTTIVFGAVMPLWAWLMKETPNKKIKFHNIDPRTIEERNQTLITHPNHILKISNIDLRKKRGKLYQAFKDFDTNRLKPCFLKEEAIVAQREFNQLIKEMNYQSDGDSDAESMQDSLAYPSSEASVN